jgi:hypothetical protein
VRQVEAETKKRGDVDVAEIDYLWKSEEAGANRAQRLHRSNLHVTDEVWQQSDRSKYPKNDQNAGNNGFCAQSNPPNPIGAQVD